MNLYKKMRQWIFHFEYFIKFFWFSPNLGSFSYEGLNLRQSKNLKKYSESATQKKNFLRRNSIFKTNNSKRRNFYFGIHIYICSALDQKSDVIFEISNLRYLYFDGSFEILPFDIPELMTPLRSSRGRKKCFRSKRN